MGTHSHAHVGPLLRDMSACGESCRAQHGSRSKTLASICGGREAVAALWPPASACPGMSCRSPSCRDGLGKVKPSSPVQRRVALTLLAGKKLLPLQAAHPAAACLAAASPCPSC